MSDDIASKLRVLISESRMTAGEKENALLLIEALAKREAVAVKESLTTAQVVAADLIDKVVDYGREIANAAVCEANYDKVTAKMHRKEAGYTLAEIAAILAASQPAQQEPNP